MDSQTYTPSGEGTDNTSQPVAGHGNWMSADLASSWVAAMRSKYGSSMTHDVEIHPEDETARVSWTIVDSSIFNVSERMLPLKCKKVNLIVQKGKRIYMK